MSKDKTSQWVQTSLDELIDIKHGWAFPGAGIMETPSNNVLVTPGNFKIGGGFKDSNKKFFEGDYPEEYLLSPGDLIVTMTDLSKGADTLGYSALVPKDGRNYLHNQRIGLVRIKSDKIRKDYLYWLMRTYHYQRFIAGSASGTTVKHTSPSSIKKYRFLLPPKKEQEEIARILSSLDDKIELNNQINRNLEEQAKVIFKSWFVDFEPFGGEPPDDWKDGTIADLGKVTGGGTPSKAKEEYYSQNGIPWITPKDLSVNKSKFISRGQTDISDSGLNNSSAIVMPKGTVLFSSRAPIGYIAIAKNEVTTNQGFKSVVPHPHVGTPFVYMFLKHNLEKIESVASGSTFKEVSGGVMKSIPALIPDNKSLSSFTNQCQPLFQKQEILEAENNILQETRDTLLPKLMSGEIAI